MKLFYKKRRYFIGTKQVHKIVGSQIVKISEINTTKIKNDVSNKGYNIASIVIGIIAIGGIPFTYYFSKGEFRLTFKTLVFIPIILWAVYNLFLKKHIQVAKESDELINIYTFNSFLKTITTPENSKIKYKNIRRICIPFIGKDALRLKNYRYDYIAYLEYHTGETRIVLASNNFQDLLVATTFLAKEAKITMSH